MKRYIVLLVVIITTAMSAMSQSTCDKLYAKAVQCQQTMTVASQNQAIALFQKAQACYDSDARKKLCASQIATCRNTINLIKNQGSGSNRKKSVDPEVLKEDVVVDTVYVFKEEPKDTIPANITVNTAMVKFKPKGGQFQKVKVTCNYPDWKVVECPDWVSYSISSDNEIVLEASKNEEKQERSAMVRVECRGAQTSFVVIQGKKSLLNKIGL